MRRIDVNLWLPRLNDITGGSAAECLFVPRVDDYAVDAAPHFAHFYSDSGNLPRLWIDAPDFQDPVAADQETLISNICGTYRISVSGYFRTGERS